MTKRLFLSMALLYFFLVFSITPIFVYAHGEDPNSVVAEVGGRKITLLELNKALGADLYEMEKRIYLIKKNKIDEYIGQTLLEKEATRRKLQIPQLLEKYVQKQAKRVRDKDVDKFYEENKAHLKGTKDQYIERIRGFLDQENYRQAYQKYLENLRRSARVKVYLEKPERFRVNLSLTKSPEMGGENAKVRIVEFSDYECPFCQQLTQTMNRISKKYGKKIYRTFKAFPLERHKNAPLAHQASFCADDQKKFWLYHEKLFENNQKLQRADLEKYAQEIKLNMDQFRQCLDSGEKFSKLQKEISEGEEAGVRSTPTLFINGQMIVGATPQQEIEEIINEELKRN